MVERSDTTGSSNGEFLALGSGRQALEEGCFAVGVVEGIGMEEALR